MQNNNAKLKLLFLFVFPIVLAFLFECFGKLFSWDTIFNLIENFLFSIILISPLFFISNTKLSSGYLMLAFMFFCFCTYFETAYYYLFSTNFSSSAIFVMLDSNLNEAKEFVNFYSDILLWIFTIMFWISSIVVWHKLKKTILLEVKLSPSKKASVTAVIIAIVLFLKLSTLIVFNLPYLIIKSNLEYYYESKRIGDYKVNKTGNFHNVSRSNSENQELYVIVIGESTNRLHFGLYNYYRQTTPELNKVKDELLIYNDVISPHAYSIGALTKILTLGNYESPEKVTEGSIIQLANSAGFDTYWLSNQRPLGAYESLITKISLASKYHDFTTTTIAGKSKVFDGKLLVEFEEILKKLKNKRNIIFLHLMGTHHEYENRYPSSFNKFKDTPLCNFASKESTKKINAYDNAILYNDALIADVINKVKAYDAKSFVLYFSDHGEEMFNDLNMAGHNEDVYSKSMFDIPFILWESSKYKQFKSIDFEPDRKYMNDDLIHSIADLLNIRALEVDSTKSIFNKNFKERKRIIKDTINYDTFFTK